MSTDVSYILFYLFAFVIGTRKTCGIPLNKRFQLETKDSSGNLPEIHQEWTHRDDDVITARRKKEVVVVGGSGNGNVVREGKSNQMTILFQNLDKYKEHFGKPKSSNPFISKGWGAGGMPFNVLYTPNSHQQKILRFTPKTTSSPNRIETERSSKETSKHETSDSQRRFDKLGQRQHVTPRKYFSVIPQLFASYGW